ncbi:hypothetical protein ACHWQZ_G011040 [Mnemiopsis leidyi]
MLILILWMQIITFVVGDHWVSKFREKDCYRCSRYDYENANFSSLVSVSQGEIVIGARNTVYKIEFGYQKVTPFNDEVPVSSNSAYQNCIDSGRTEQDCQNYYKVLVKITDNDLMLCGTSSFQPMCDIRHLSDLNYKSRDHVLSGDTICPSDPNTATSVIVLESDRTVGFSATCIDECNDYQISRINLLPGSLSFNGRTMRTTDWLNRPTFVYSFEEGEYVYFLFYETAIEVKTEQVYSRVARICKNDIGSGQEYFSNYFLSFSKARIYCTSNKPGEPPFDHNEIGGAFYKDRVLYAVFSGQRNVRTGSILCSYQIKDIDAVFSGPYLSYDNSNREWITTENQPFSCSNKKSINVAATQTMMERAISQSEPLYYTQTETRLTSVAVITKHVGERDHTIIYAGSEEGYVVRVGLEAGLTGVTHYSIVKTAPRGAVISLSISQDTNIIYALSNSWVIKIPTSLEDACQHAATCSECLDLYYPYCSWCKTTNEMRCVASQSECLVSDLVRPTETCLPLPTFREKPAKVTAARGTPVTLLCSGRDGEAGRWRREDGAPITRKAVETNRYLMIPSVQLSDMGTYVCTLNNTSGRVSEQGTITVTEKPYFTMQPENISAFEEDINIELQCQAEGSPRPTIQWFKEGANIPDGSEITELGFLKIYRVLKEDEGKYWCTATNSEGHVSSKIGQLVISEGAMEKTEDPPAPPAIPNITMVGMVVAIVVSAVICFVIGLIVHNLYRKHRKKRESDVSQTPGGHVFDGRVHTRGPWTPVNTLPYQMCRPEEWRDSGMFSCPYPSTLVPPPLPLRSELLTQLPNMDSALLEEDEAPPAYDDRDSPPLLPPTPASLQAPMCFPPARYTPTHFNTCPNHQGVTYCGVAPPCTSSHYTALNSDYAVITQSAPQPTTSSHRQYSMDLRADRSAQNNGQSAPSSRSGPLSPGFVNHVI